jgi:adenine-specific DNA methylase
LTRYPATRETINNTFSNQALNTMFNFPCRGLVQCENVFVLQASVERFPKVENASVKLSDARDIRDICDFWITDPPYADAVNYHELGDFFLAWYDKQLVRAFPEWIPDSRAELAVRGDGEDFRRSMVEIYQNLAGHMPNNGMQMVMFTHQDPAVWADLGMILWAAGLKATAAWTISTETEAAGIKKGNYVQGTVCLVLRKRITNEPGFLDEVYPLVEDEVKQQIVSPYSKLRDLITGQNDFVKKQTDILEFAIKFCRKGSLHVPNVNDGEMENEWWLYCIRWFQ